MEPVIRKFEVLRFRPEQDEEPVWQTYEVPCLPDYVVLDALNAIKDDIDPTIRRSPTAGRAAWACAAAAAWSSTAGRS
jgi:succinate dehydrogenase/fumarate reductase-like Fe-S protein